MKNRPYVLKTQEATLTYSELGDVLVNSIETISISLPTPVVDAYYCISNIGSAVIAVMYGATELTTLKETEQCTCFANGTTSWVFSKGGGAMTKEEIEAVLTGEITSHSHPILYELPADGSDGQVLVKDGFVSREVKWATLNTNSGAIMNAAFSLNHITLTEESATFDIGIPSYDSAGDQLMVFQGGIYQTLGTDFSIEGTVVSKITGVWDSGTSFDIIVVATGEIILPGGGTTGQALLKVSNTDYDVTWGDVAASGGDTIWGGM